MDDRPLCDLCGAAEPELLQLQEGIHIRAAGVEGRFDVRTVLCRSCGLVFTAPQPPEDLLDAFYARQFRELFAPEGDDERIPGCGSRLDQADWLEARLGRRTGRRVLEIGCYEGYLLKLLADRGALCTGVEPCLSAAAFGRERWGVEIRTGMFEQLDLPPSAFDLVVLSHVLEHVRSPADVLRRCRRLLADGGALFIEVPHLLRPRVDNVVNYFTFDHLTQFSPRTLGHLARRFGFCVEATETDFPFPAFRQLFTAVPGAEREAAADPEAVAESREAVRRYVRDRQRFLTALRERLVPHLGGWIEDGARVALYGAGDHTEHLLQLTDLSKAQVIGVVDGDPSKQGGTCRGYPVFAPAWLEEQRPDAVVISSYDFQEEMVEAVRALCSPPPQIVTLYERVAAFSSFRGAAGEP